MDNYSVKDFLSSGVKEEEIVKAIEKSFRGLPEYKIWSSMNRKPMCEWKDCPVTQEISDLQVHHYPLSLYDVVELIVQANLECSPYEIIGKVLNYHMEGKVGNITLCRHHHSLYHELTKKGVSTSPFLEIEEVVDAEL